MQKKLIVVKAGTSSLTKDDGSISSAKSQRHHCSAMDPEK